MPPIESLKLLSDIYQISINEILSGERLNQQNYKEAAEDNITSALEKMESKEKKFENMMLLIMGITSVLTIAIMFLLPNGDNLTTMERIKEIIVIIFVWAMAFISNTLNIVAIGLRKNK